MKHRRKRRRGIDVITALVDGHAAIQFSRPTRTAMFTPAQARDLAWQLWEMAREADVAWRERDQSSAAKLIEELNIDLGGEG